MSVALVDESFVLVRGSYRAVFPKKKKEKGYAALSQIERFAFLSEGFATARNPRLHFAFAGKQYIFRFMSEGLCSIQRARCRASGDLAHDAKIRFCIERSFFLREYSRDAALPIPAI